MYVAMIFQNSLCAFINYKLDSQASEFRVSLAYLHQIDSARVQAV